MIRGDFRRKLEKKLARDHNSPEKVYIDIHFSSNQIKKLPEDVSTSVNAQTRARKVPFISGSLLYSSDDSLAF